MGLEGAEKGMDVRRHSAYMTPLNPPQILLEQCFSGRVDFAPRAHWGRSEDTCVCHNLGRGVCYCISQVEARVLLTSYNARHSPPPPRKCQQCQGWEALRWEDTGTCYLSVTAEKARAQRLQPLTGSWANSSSSLCLIFPHL